MTAAAQRSPDGRDDRAQAAFQGDVRSATVHNLRFAASLGALIVPMFWLLDRIVVPDLAVHFLWWRLTAAAALLMLVGATFTELGRARVIALGYLALLSAALPVSAMTAFIDPGVTPYYAGLSLAMLFNGVLFPWAPVHTAAVNGLLVVSFLAPVFWQGGPSSFPAFANNTFFIVVTAAISTISSWSLYNERRRRFELSWSLERRSQDLADANERLREVDEAKSRFFANVSHELRTPLTLALSPVEALLTSPTLPQELQETLHGVHADLLALRRRIEDLIDLARLDGGKMRLRRQAVELRGVVEQVVAAARPFAARHGIELCLEPSPPLQRIAADPSLIEQIVFNLVSNALKFTPRGGRVVIELAPGQAELLLTVSDTGPGISRAEQAELFTRFGHTADSSSARGSGLGLALVKEFAELHGGAVRVESELGAGTEFTVSIPVGTPLDTSELETAQAHRGSLALDFETELLLRESDARSDLPNDGRPTVLVVEDNPRLRELVVRTLATDFRVVEAVDGQDALERMRSAQPHVVVSDMMMPRLDGRELLDALRNDSRWRGVPVLLLTAHGDASIREDLLEAGASDFIAKPFSVRELRARVRNFVTLRSAQMALAGANMSLAAALEQVRLAQGRAIRAEKLAAIGQIASGIGHEVKNPVNFLLNFARPSRMRLERIAENLRGLPGAAPYVAEVGAVHDALGRVIEGGERIVTIVNGLQAFARGGGARIRVDVDQEVAATLRITDGLVPEGVQLVFTPGGAGTLIGSSLGIGAVVSNLVSNALRAVSPGGHVWVETHGDDDSVLIVVRDDGVGIPEAIRERIWDPFFTTRAAGEGLGLGLALVQRIVHEDMGGTITLDSAVSMGSTFRLVLPRQGVRDVPSDWSDLSATA